jgi:large subunit ribosomal protein L4e
MKLTIRTTKNAEKGTLELPLQEPVRPDIIKRAVLSLQSRRRQPYGADPRAGLKHSADVSRRRRKYRGSYGHGISRVPRKVLSRSGTRFFWVGAEAPGTVGGRRAHPPKAEKQWEKRINRKENRKAINSALTAALDRALVLQRGHKVPETYPFLLADDFEGLKKTSEVIEAFTALGLAEDLKRGATGAKTVLVVTENEGFAMAARNIQGVDVCNASELNAELLAPGAHPGRATLLSAASVAKMTGQEPKPPAKKAAKKAEVSA